MINAYEARKIADTFDEQTFKDKIDREVRLAAKSNVNPYQVNIQLNEIELRHYRYIQVLLKQHHFKYKFYHETNILSILW